MKADYFTGANPPACCQENSDEVGCWMSLVDFSPLTRANSSTVKWFDDLNTDAWESIKYCAASLSKSDDGSSRSIFVKTVVDCIMGYFLCWWEGAE